MGYDLLIKSFKVLMLFTPDHVAVERIVKDIESFTSVKKFTIFMYGNSMKMKYI